MFSLPLKAAARIFLLAIALSIPAHAQVGDIVETDPLSTLLKGDAENSSAKQEGSKKNSVRKERSNAPVEIPTNLYKPSRMFGNQLFRGSFGNLRGGGFNPDYRIGVGDTLQVHMWGGFNYDNETQVDPQGNIFLPSVGPVNVLNVPNSELNNVVEREVRRTFKSIVNIYVTLDVSQPVKVFVTGFVRQPGLYGGNAAESTLSYLDRAGGVDPDRGSYVDITVKRGELVRKKVSLYDFLLDGKLELVQFQDGDVIIVGPKQKTFSAGGEVLNPNDFEFSGDTIPLTLAIQMAKPKPGATHVSIVRRQGPAQRTEYHSLADISGLTLRDGDAISLTADRYAGTIQVRVEGAHSGEHALVLAYGATMRSVYANLKPNGMSELKSIQLFRKSVAERQREMLELALSKLQEAAFTARSDTSEEAALRAREAEMISQFVEKAHKVEPKGQVVLHDENIENTVLEDGDVIRIPEKSSVVMVHGEVLLPNGVLWQDGNDARDYIEQVGGFSQSADTARIIVLKQNGEAAYAGSTHIQPGDEIIVFPKIASKNIEIARGITQILYQIAIATKVALDI